MYLRPHLWKLRETPDSPDRENDRASFGVVNVSPFFRWYSELSGLMPAKK